MSVNPRVLPARFVESNYAHPLPVRKRCKSCGLHVRGPKHDEGDDHINRSNKKDK